MVEVNFPRAKHWFEYRHLQLHDLSILEIRKEGFVEHFTKNSYEALIKLLWFWEFSLEKSFTIDMRVFLLQLSFSGDEIGGKEKG